MKLRTANEALAFLLELVALALLASWGVRLGRTALAKTSLAVALPLAAAILWGLFAAPKARFKVPLPAQLLVKALVFGAATAALATTGHMVWSVIFAAAVIANTTAATLWRSRHGVPGVER